MKATHKNAEVIKETSKRYGFVEMSTKIWARQPKSTDVKNIPFNTPNARNGTKFPALKVNI